MKIGICIPAELHRSIQKSREGIWQPERISSLSACRCYLAGLTSSIGASARTPSPSRPLAATNMTPFCSRTRLTASIVLVRGSTSPRSIFATALRDRMARSANSCCDQPSNARPALICRAVIIQRTRPGPNTLDHQYGLIDYYRFNMTTSELCIAL